MAKRTEKQVRDDLKQLHEKQNRGFYDDIPEYQKVLKEYWKVVYKLYNVQHKYFKAAEKARIQGIKKFESLKQELKTIEENKAKKKNK